MNHGLPSLSKVIPQNKNCIYIFSEPQSSFNSSLEGSYELHPTSRSPPPASDRQETMAETISEYKQDEEILEKVVYITVTVQ